MRVSQHIRAQESMNASGESGSVLGRINKEITVTVLASSSYRPGKGPPSLAETCFDIVSGGRLLRFVFKPTQTLARVNGKFMGQDIGWAPAMGVAHNLTVIMRSNKIHTFRITDGTNSALSWSKDFYHTGWYPQDPRSLGRLRVLPCSNRKDLRKMSPTCYNSSKEQHCFSLARNLSEQVLPVAYRSEGICHPNVPFSHCSAVGDPHYSSFLNPRYNFQGNGTYMLTFSAHNSMKAQVFNCPMPRRRGRGTVSVTVALAVQIMDTLVLQIGTDTLINGNATGPGMYNLSNGVEVEVSPKYLVVKGPTTASGFGEIRASSRNLGRSPTGSALGVFAELPTAHVLSSTGLCNCATKNSCMSSAGSKAIPLSSNLFPASYKTALDEACCPETGLCLPPEGTEPDPTAEDLCSECSVGSGRNISTARAECSVLDYDPVQFEACTLDYCACCQEDDPEECSAMTFEGSSEDTGGEPFEMDNHSCFQEQLPTVVPQAEADPHCRNLRGDVFDVLISGQVSMVSVPREGPDRGDNLQVDAYIEPISRQPCAPTVIKRLDITGDWLPQGQGLEELILRTRNGSNANGGLPLIPDAWNVWMARAKRDKKRNHRVSMTVSSWKKRSILHLTVGPVTLDIKQRKGTQSGVSYLDMVVRGLGALGNNAGGILGFDDYEDMLEAPEDCKPSTKPWVALSRWAGEVPVDADVVTRRRLLSTATTA